MSRSLKEVSDRLILLQQALGLSAAELCRRADIGRNQWSQFQAGAIKKRRITLATAYKLKDTFGVTLEWIYDGDPARLPVELAEALRRLRKREAA